MRTVITRWVLALSISMLAMGLVLVTAARAQEAVGEWHGLLRISGVELRLGVAIERVADGGLKGVMTSPDQGSPAIPLSEVRMDGGKLSFGVPAIRGRYEGQWDAGQGVWNGQWTQGAPLPLTLAKGPVPARARPQLPAKPYPYREEEVGFDSAPGVKLAGTLTLPAGEGPFPAAVLITGSGAQDRDEYLLGHRPFLVLADHLTREGVAVLRYDDRGYGKSTGRFQTATSTDFAADAAAAVAFLRGRKEIDPRRVGLIGHSEGGMVAPMAAVKDPKIAFVVLLAGPGAPSRQLMAAQRAAVGKIMGVPADAIARNEVMAGRIDAVLADTADWEMAKVEVTKLIGEGAAAAGRPADQVIAANQLLFTAWYREFIAYDPRPNLAKLAMPVLAVNGANDLQVVASQNLPAIREALKANKDATVVELPGLNHLFQTSSTGDPRDYGRIEETFAPQALTIISDWVVAHTGARR